MTSSSSSPATTTRLRNKGASSSPDILRGCACAPSAGEDGHLGPRPRSWSGGGWSRGGGPQSTDCGVVSSAAGWRSVCRWRKRRRGGGSGGVDRGRTPASSPLYSAAALRFINHHRRYGHTRYGMRIGNRAQAFEWYHFQWPFMTPNPDCKVITPLLSAECRKNGTIWRHYYNGILVGTYTNVIHNGFTFNDLEWPMWLSEIFSDIKQRTACLRQLSFLSINGNNATWFVKF